MDNNYALIKDDVVENVVTGTEEYAAEIAPNWDYVVQSDIASIGDIYDPVGGTFTTPAPPPWPVIRTISQAKWYDRWTDEDLGTFRTQAKTSNAMLGWLDWIDKQPIVYLDTPRIVDKLQSAVDNFHITQAAMDIILADVTEEEYTGD